MSAPLSSPLGSPFGIGTPVTATEPPTGKLSLSRYLNPGTGAPQADSATGHLATMPRVRQRFLILLRTLRGSSSVLPEFGLDLPVKMDGTFERRCEASIRAGAASMTDVEKVARIDGIAVTRLALGRVHVVVSFTDLTTGTADQASAVI